MRPGLPLSYRIAILRGMMSKKYHRYTFGPFVFERSIVRRGDGPYWTSYRLVYKQHEFMKAGPDRFTIQYETKMRERP